MILSFPSPNLGALRLAEARKQRDELQRQLIELDRLEEELFVAQASVQPWHPPAKKAQLWEVQDLLPEARGMVEHLLQTVESLYAEAAEHDDCARAELADLHWRLLSRAEERDEQELVDRHLRALRDCDDGRYAALIDGTARLQLKTEPAGAKVRVYRLAERGRQLVRQQRRELGRTPVGPLAIDPGSYLLEIRLKGHSTAYRPLVVTRGAELQLRVSLFSQRQIGPDFVQISAGRFHGGGDDRAPGSSCSRQVFVDNFAIARHPVTTGEYLLFLDELASDEPQLALKYTPRDERKDPFDSLDPRLPVTGISLEAARAYCAWLSASTGVTHRLPTEEEWEKAARGVDGRAYPWGNAFDPSFCHTRESTPGRPRRLPVGSFAADESVYGVRDMAGLVCEWTDSEQTPAAESEDDPRSCLAAIRGGSFESGPDRCRCAQRALVDPHRPLPDVGFRLVRPLPPGGGDTVMPPSVPTVATVSAPQQAPIRRADNALASERLLAICQQMLLRPATETVDLLLGQTVQLTVAERGFVIERHDDGQLAVFSCSGGNGSLPATDQQFDGHVARAALEQQRVIELTTNRPLLALPLPKTPRCCMVLERRFSAQPFVEEERLLAETASGLLALALRLEASPNISRPPVGQSLDDAVAALERDLLIRTLSAERGNVSRTARQLGLSRNGLRARLRRYDLDIEDFR